MSALKLHTGGVYGSSGQPLLSATARPPKGALAPEPPKGLEDGAEVLPNGLEAAGCVENGLAAACEPPNGVGTGQREAL